jgi:acyl-CoA synthetase (NDP forming)
MPETKQRPMLEPEAIVLLKEYGITYPEHGLAANANEAARIAKEIGCPAVLKVVSPDVLHKSDAGGVMVNLADPDAVRDGYTRMMECVLEKVPGAQIRGALVCKQAESALEVIVGAIDDLTFGPTLMFGLGGIFTEVLKDVAFRVAPIERRDAEEMIREIKAYPMLAGVRGQAPRDTAALVDLLLAVSKMVTEHPEIKELDLNPVRLYEKGLTALDARILVQE